jgi:DNA-binding CsgD family transcriptional regulator
MPLIERTERGPFTSDEARQHAMVGPRFASAMALAAKFAAFQTTCELTTLERIGRAALVIDGRGRVQDLNHLAEALLGADLDVVSGRVTASSAACNTQLQRLIAAANAAGNNELIPRGTVVVHRDEQPWLLVEVMPVTESNSLFNNGRIILLLTDLSAPATPDTATLRMAYGLTAAEARLAVRLTAGRDLEETAASLGITRATASSQLRAIFAKTSTHRQAELIGLLWHFRPTMGAPQSIHA